MVFFPFATHSTISFSIFQRYEKHCSSQMFLKPTLVPIVPGSGRSDLKLSTTEAEVHHSSYHGKKVLKNQLQRNRSLASNSMSEQYNNKPWSVNTRNSLLRQESLPSDFKATVATLPPIVASKRPQFEAAVNVQSLAVDLDFVKTRQKKALNFATEQI